MRKTVFLLLCAVLLTGCTKNEEDALVEYRTRAVTLPDGAVIRAEVMTREQDMMRGMMFRDSLAEDRGMLFFHGGPGRYQYFMYQVKMPLDIVWMDSRRRVVEIVENAPPCKTRASECPRFGGEAEAQVVLELAGGVARKHGIQVGSVLSF